MSLPSASIVADMLAECTNYYERLIAGGCVEDVALDRTWDAYRCALARMDVHCFDPRDRLFESKLRLIREREPNA